MKTFLYFCHGIQSTIKNNNLNRKYMMKKFTLAAVLLSMSLFASAQSKYVTLSSINGTNVEQYDGQVADVKMNRYMFTGWNTVSFPFDLSTDKINEFFGNDCRLEILTGISGDSNAMKLYFEDVKSEGIKANTPYILYFSGEPQNVRIIAESTIQSGESKLTFSANGYTVNLNGADKIMSGDNIYGIFAKDNTDSKFAKIGETTGCYATRCYITVDGDKDVNFIPVHNEKSTTAISKVSANDKDNDKVYDINGVQKKSVSKGINIVKGKKFAVK